MSTAGLGLFDAAKSRELRDTGKEVAAHSYGADEWLTKARLAAERIATDRREVTIDDVLRICPRPSHISANATGSVFKGKKWKCIGFAQSEQVQRHASVIRRWVVA